MKLTDWQQVPNLKSKQEEKDYIKNFVGISDIIIIPDFHPALSHVPILRVIYKNEHQIGWIIPTPNHPSGTKFGISTSDEIKDAYRTQYPECTFFEAIEILKTIYLRK